MRQFKVVLLGIGALALSFGTASAGLNPANAGLGILNNQSAVCVACHTVAPGAGAQQGSHFVYDAVNNRNTNTGGGGSYNIGGAARTAGQYLKVSQWTGSVGSTGYSKYGRRSDNVSISRSTDNATYGAARVGADADFQAGQIICESCHNIVRNVAGGNNLLAPMAALTASQQTQVTGVVSGNYYSMAAASEATLCVGCHGFMYSSVATPAADQGTLYGDARNTSDFGSRKGNNNAHYIEGVKYAQNHHVGTGDKVGTATADAGLLWRDVKVIPAAFAVIDTVLGQTRGQVPQLDTWVADGGKVKGLSTNLNCVMCHAAPHTGLNGTAASILRDTNAGGITLAARTVNTSPERTYRIGEAASTRTWMSGYNDSAYCFDCHTIK